MPYWVKVWEDILDDRWYHKQNDKTKAFIFESIILAGRGDRTGRLPCEEDIAFVTRRDINEVKKLCNYLSQSRKEDEVDKPGFLTREDGRWVVTNYAKRQAPVDAATRQREHRRRKYAERSQDVTDDNKDVTTGDVERKKDKIEKERKIEKTAYAAKVKTEYKAVLKKMARKEPLTKNDLYWTKEHKNIFGDPK